jgi:hypothetical protein
MRYVQPSVINDYGCGSSGVPQTIACTSFQTVLVCNPPALFNRLTRANPHFRYQQLALHLTIPASAYQPRRKGLALLFYWMNHIAQQTINHYQHCNYWINQRVLIAIL